MGENLTNLLNNKISVLESYLDYKSKLAITSSEVVSEYIQENASLELKRAKSNLLRIKSERNRRAVVYIISILIMVIFLWILRVNYRRKIELKERENLLQQKELKIEKLENEKVNRALSDKSKDLSNVFMQTTLQEEWSQEVIDELLVIRKLKKDEEKEDQIKSLIRSLKQKSSAYKKILTQQKGMDKADSAFFRRLEELYPQLSRAEKETCGLIRLNLDSKEIAMIRNIHPSSVRKLRQRIRNKIELKPEIDLYDFIQKV